MQDTPLTPPTVIPGEVWGPTRTPATVVSEAVLGPGQTLVLGMRGPMTQDLADSIARAARGAGLAGRVVVVDAARCSVDVVPTARADRFSGAIASMAEPLGRLLAAGKDVMLTRSGTGLHAAYRADPTATDVEVSFIVAADL